MKAWWSAVPGLVFIDLPEDILDEYITIVALRLSGSELELYK
jgi:alpha-L-fucosidase